jgi:Rrf2 family protein
MKLSQSVAYAVHAVLRLAENHEASPISCKKLAEQGNMPERFLLQILRDLAKQGILLSTRGGGGGFMLDRRPDEISLLEVIEAVEGPMGAALPLKGNFPHPAGDRLHKVLRTINEEVRRQLHAVSLSDLLGESAVGKRC